MNTYLSFRKLTDYFAGFFWAFFVIGKEKSECVTKRKREKSVLRFPIEKRKDIFACERDRVRFQKIISATIYLGIHFYLWLHYAEINFFLRKDRVCLFPLAIPFNNNICFLLKVVENISYFIYWCKRIFKEEKRFFIFYYYIFLYKFIYNIFLI